MKKFLLAAALALTFGGAHAAVLEIATNTGASEAVASAFGNPFALLGSTEVVAPAKGMSELPEPEVFAMMLVGLVLIGWRASRDSGEKFK